MSEKLKTNLVEFSDRVALVVTDLNGFRSAIENEEITEADFDESITLLFSRLRAVEQAVEQLGNEFWSR